MFLRSILGLFSSALNHRELTPWAVFPGSAGFYLDLANEGSGRRLDSGGKAVHYLGGPLASNRIGPSPEVPMLLTTVHLSVSMPLMGTSYLRSKSVDC